MVKHKKIKDIRKILIPCFSGAAVSAIVIPAVCLTKHVSHLKIDPADWSWGVPLKKPERTLIFYAEEPLAQGQRYETSWEYDVLSTKICSLELGELEPINNWDKMGLPVKLKANEGELKAGDSIRYNLFISLCDDKGTLWTEKFWGLRLIVDD